MFEILFEISLCLVLAEHSEFPIFNNLLPLDRLETFLLI
jgi:hypothetical protein